MNSRNLLLTLAFSAMTAGCMTAPEQELEVSLVQSEKEKSPEDLAPDIKKILAAGGLNPANPSGAAVSPVLDRAPVALALAKPEPVAEKRTLIAKAQPKKVKPRAVVRKTAEDQVRKTRRF